MVEHAKKAEPFNGLVISQAIDAPVNSHFMHLSYNIVGRADDGGVRSYNMIARRTNGDVVYCQNFGGCFTPWPNNLFTNLLVVRPQGWISTYDSSILTGDVVDQIAGKSGDMHDLFWEFILGQDPEKAMGGSADFSPFSGDLIHYQQIWLQNLPKEGKENVKHLVVGESRAPFPGDAIPGRGNPVFHEATKIHDFGYYDLNLDIKFR